MDIDNSFLVLWFICLSSSLVYFKNGSEYLTRGTAKAFITLIRFLLKLSRSSRLLFCFCFVLFFLFFLFLFFFFFVLFCFVLFFVVTVVVFWWGSSLLQLLRNIGRGHCFQYSELLLVFLLSKHSNSFLIW